MNKITYQIRTRSNVPVYAFDDLSRAKAELARSEKRLGTTLKLFEIVHAERELI